MYPRASEERRIHLLAGLILITVTLVAGVSVFSIMQGYAKTQLEKTLQLSLQGYVLSIDAAIQARVDASSTIAERPVLGEQLAELQNAPVDDQALHALQQGAASFLPSGFRSVAFYGLEGNPLARAGEPVTSPELNVPLATEHEINLLWDQGYVVRVRLAVVRDGRVLGSVVTESSMPKLTAMFADVSSLGKSGELALCAPLGMDMQCFPLAVTKKVLARIPRIMHGAPLPMSFALAGGTGVIVAEDYRRQEVVAAYSPVVKLGLGAVLKIDTDELYAPVWAQVKRVGPLIVIAPVIGLILLYWLVRPLVRQLFVSERQARDANEQLSDSETRIRTIINSIEEGIVTITEDGRIASFNAGAEHMFHYAASDVLGSDISQLLPGITKGNHDAYFQQFLRGAKTNPIGHGCEVVGLGSGGRSFPLDLRISEVKLGGELHYIATLRDITDRKAAEATILHLANHDPLTGLPNRNLLQDRIDQAVSQHKRNKSQFVVMFIDLDQFKTINDSLGHQHGDALLCSVSARLTGCLREVDTVARQGGDEFIVLLNSIASPGDAAIVAQKILAALSEPHLIEGQELHAGASIGIAIYPQDGDTAEALLKNSDMAMYHAKEMGRNNYQFFTDDMNARAGERLMLANRLRQALLRDELKLHYQPIVSITDGRIVATEALARWHHPDLGSVPPLRFIAIAEETGLIVQLGEWALRSACLQLKDWQARKTDTGRMVINLSARQFRQENLLRSIVAILHETGVRADALGLEITESAIMDNPETAIALLGELRDMGVQISLDDFGTGYSSLSYLKRFPIDKLKIDRSFVQDITTDQDDKALVTAILAMAQSLGIRVVAEGVELPEQLDFIRNKGCEEYQGYYFSKPCPAEDLDAMLSERYASAL